jgi:hypothetical protein
MDALYNKQTYLDIHGKDIALTILPFLITIMITSYATYTAILAKIKNDWNSHRCNPIYMPFAGMIMPQPDQSMMDTTIQNFSYCVKQDTSMVFSIVMMPLEFTMFLIIEFLDATMEAIVAFMNFLKWLRDMIGEIAQELYNKILNFIIPLMEITIHMRDALAKSNGVLITMLYTTMNIYNTTVSGLVNVVNVLNDVLIEIIAVALAMMATIILAPVGLLTILTVVIPTLVIYIMMETFIKDVMHETTKKAPKKPNVHKHKKK